MKLLVFAHTPPPHHGQSYMVQLLLERLREDPSFQVLHVNARLSSGTEDIGTPRVGKLLLLLKYCAQAIWLRLRHGVRNFYYVPANPSRAALLRDWIVMLLCRPLFPKLVFHWHAAGLGYWLKDGPAWQRTLTQWLMNRATLSIALSDYNRSDAELFRPKRIEVIGNGIPDPCPHFHDKILPARHARLAERTACVAQRHFKVLYIGLCLREKGVFDAFEAVRLANEAGRARFNLAVAGSFWRDHEQAEFQRRCAGLKHRDGHPQIEYLGFVSGEEKRRLFEQTDCLLFPTYYAAESFGLVLLEAMAYGLPVITTNWRMIPEVLPAEYPGIVEPRAPKQIALRLEEALSWDFFEVLRNHYLDNFTAEGFWRKMEAALQSL